MNTSTSPIRTDARRWSMRAPAKWDASAVRALFERPEVVIEVDLGAGDATARAWGCDLSKEYVRINAEYTT